MRVLFDTNVVLDVLMDRSPFAEPAARLFAAVEHGTVGGYLGATTVTTVHYLTTKALGRTRGTAAISSLLDLFDVAPVTRTVLTDALSLAFEDYEDAVLHEVARHAGIEAIVTRDDAGFRKSQLAVFSPAELVRALSADPGTTG